MLIRSGKVGSPVNHFPELSARELIFWSSSSHLPLAKMFNSTPPLAMAESCKSCHKHCLCMTDEWADRTLRTTRSKASSQNVLYLLKNKREQTGENCQKKDTHFPPHWHQCSIKLQKEWVVFKVYTSDLDLRFQGDINKIWTENSLLPNFSRTHFQYH